MSAQPAIVLDCGSGSIKAGCSEQDLPSYVIPSVVAKLLSAKNENDGTSFPQNDELFGESALKKRGLYSLRYPIEHGIVVDWNEMEKLLHHTFFNELRITPKNESIFLSEAALNPKAHREKAAELFFETFDVHSMSMASQSTLGLYSSGRTTGTVLESGEGVTHCIPIFEGFSFPQAISRMDLGGRDVTDYLVKLLSEKGHDFFTTADREVVKEIKEKMCYVSQHFDAEINEIEMNEGDGDEDDKSSFLNDDASKYFYELPDGNVIHLGTERVKAAEALFQPQLIGSEESGIAKLICDSIMKTEVDLRRLFWQNLVLCGGNTLFNGFQTRLHSELSGIAPKSVRVKIDGSNHRKYCVWIGGCVLSNIPSFREQWMTKQQYEENGTSRISMITPF